MTNDPLIGRQLSNFLVEDVIGRGGMAQVYSGQDVKLERPVAIKVIDARFRHDPTYTERFIREAQAVATWRHDNIVQIYYADDEDNLYYFVMEYIEGKDLKQRLTDEYISQNKLMHPQAVLHIGWAIAKALDYAHEQGVIHRDVKPGNVMVANDGRIVLMDFGLALDVEQGSMGEVFGSSHYIAPEQARRSANAVPQSDLYALGVILYEILTGQVPFDDPSPTAVALQHLTTPPPPPRDLNPKLSEEIEAILLKALDKEREQRYQSGRALMKALEAAFDLEQPPNEKVAVAKDGGEKTSLSPSQAAKPKSKPATPKDGGSKPRPVPKPDSQGTTDSLLGQQLDEYRLEALLGQGGMARVYRGTDVRLDRPVAIKVIDTPFQDDADYLERFEREAQAIAKLDHPNIVTVYRFGEVDGLLYIAIKYIEGNDFSEELAAYRQKESRPTLETAINIIGQVCSALDYAHEQGIIHRDVKPGNMLLDKEGRLFLTDFGLALFTEVGTQGQIFGSPHYISPEQAISSAGVVPQSDIYAVGVILYETFTGKVPFEAKDTLEVAMKHVSDPPPSPHEINPDIDPMLEAVILKALAKDPEDRYQSGAHLMEALNEVLEMAEQPPEEIVKESPPEPVQEAQEEAISSEPPDHKPERPLPPIPAAVAKKEAKKQTSEPSVSAPAPTIDESGSSNSPKEVPAPQSVSSPASNQIPWLYVGIGVAIILILGVILALLFLL
ncbi:MAG: protein kinase [Chloroflexota bacterium]